MSKIDRDTKSFEATLISPRVREGLSQLSEEACEHLILDIAEKISADIVLEGIGFERPGGAIVNWSHSAGDSVKSTFVSFKGQD